MSIRTRALLVMTALGGVALPLATAHTLVPALAAHSGDAAHFDPHLDLIPLFALTALSLLPLLGLGRAVARWWVARRHLATLDLQATPRMSEGVAYVRVPGDQVALFTAGLRRPVIYATAGAERALDPPALCAALLHEQAHVAQHHVRWLALVALTEAAVGMLPGARRLLNNLRLEMEWRADRAALDAGAKREDLFDAIVSASGGVAGAVALAGVGTRERLAWLAQPDAALPVSDGRTAPLFAELFGLPLVAHALIWTGILCAACSHLS